MAFAFVNNYPTTQPWSIGTGNQLTLTSIPVLAGDVLVVGVGVEGANSGVWGAATVTMNGSSFTKVENSSTSSTDAKAAIFHLQVGFTGTYNIVIDRISTGSTWWGGLADQIRGSDGIGATNTSNNAGDPAHISLTTTRANSAIHCLIVDWQALDGATRTWESISPSSTGTELFYQRNSSRATAYMNRWNDVGSIGTKTVGLSNDIAGGTLHSAVVALEVLLAASGESYSVTTSISLGLAVSNAAAKTGSATSSIPLGLASSATASKAASSSAALHLDINPNGSDGKVGSSNSTIGLSLVDTLTGSKQVSANTSINLVVGLFATAAKIGVTYAELLLALGIEAIVGEVPEEYTVSATLGIGLSVAADVHKDANASVPINLVIGFDGDAAKTVTATVSLPVLLSLATSAIKAGQSNTALAIMLAISGIGDNPDNDRDIVFTLTTLQGYNLVLSNLEGYDLHLSTIRKE